MTAAGRGDIFQQNSFLRGRWCEERNVFDRRDSWSGSVEQQGAFRAGSSAFSWRCARRCAARRPKWADLFLLSPVRERLKQGRGNRGRLAILRPPEIDLSSCPFRDFPCHTRVTARRDFFIGGIGRTHISRGLETGFVAGPGTHGLSGALSGDQCEKKRRSWPAPFGPITPGRNSHLEGSGNSPAASRSSRAGRKGLRKKRACASITQLARRPRARRAPDTKTILRQSSGAFFLGSRDKLGASYATSRALLFAWRAPAGLCLDPFERGARVRWCGAAPLCSPPWRERALLLASHPK